MYTDGSNRQLDIITEWGLIGYVVSATQFWKRKTRWVWQDTHSHKSIAMYMVSKIIVYKLKKWTMPILTDVLQNGNYVAFLLLKEF